MDRRDFNKGLFGSVLGFLTASRQSFTAEQVVPIATPRRPDVSGYRMAMWDDRRQVFATPRVEAVLVQPGSISFFAESIDIARSIKVPGVSLISPENKVLLSKFFYPGEQRPIQFVCTDTLRCSTTISWNPAYQLEDVNYMMCHELDRRGRNDVLDRDGRGLLETQRQFKNRIFAGESRLRAFRVGANVFRQIGRPSIMFEADSDRLGVGDGQRLITLDGTVEGDRAKDEAIAMKLIAPNRNPS